MMLISSFAVAMPCAEGTFSESGAMPCMNCPIGSYTDEPGSTQCTPCPAGSFSDAEGQIECTQCPIGQYQADTGSSSCNSCTPGSFAAVTGQLSCTKCPADTFQDSYEAMVCIDCPLASTSLPGANVCVASLNSYTCPAGHYEQSSECFDCPVGTYAEDGDGFCRVCEAGKFSALTQSAACEDCPAGYSSNYAIGRTDCRFCDPGSFAENSGMAGCQLCSAGTFSAMTQATSCELCPNNSFSNMIGASACQACPDDLISAPGSSVCTPENEVNAIESASLGGGCRSNTVNIGLFLLLILQSVLSISFKRSHRINKKYA